MGKPKSNLSLHRPRKRKNKLMAAKSLWVNTEDVVFGCSSVQYNRSFASNIKSPRTLKGPKVKTFTPSKRTVILKSPSPKKCVPSLKRMMTKSPRIKLHETNKHVEKTPSKSSSTKKVRKSLIQDLFICEDDKASLEIDDSSQSANSQVTHPLDSRNCKAVQSDKFKAIVEETHESIPDHVELNDTVDEITKLLQVVIASIVEEGFDKTLLEFFKQVSLGQFLLQNISFLLWIEVIKWFSCRNISTMRYSDATKKFWKLGYRLFGGRFIHYMRGYKKHKR